MGNCNSNDGAATRRVPPEAQQRRLVRQSTSTDDFRRQLSDYHAKPQPALAFRSKRPSPIYIADPAGPGSLGLPNTLNHSSGSDTSNPSTRLVA